MECPFVFDSRARVFFFSETGEEIVVVERQNAISILMKKRAFIKVRVDFESAGFESTVAFVKDCIKRSNDFDEIVENITAFQEFKPGLFKVETSNA